jgi:hypothetical protein
MKAHDTSRMGDHRRWKHEHVMARLQLYIHAIEQHRPMRLMKLPDGSLARDSWRERP